MEDRCNEAFDCEDNGDEKECDYFTIDPMTYHKEYPPIIKGRDMNVYVRLIINQLQDIRELDMTFNAKFTLKLGWTETRLTYINLLDTDLKNLVWKENRAKLWIPPLVFNNTDENVMVADQPNAFLFIFKRGNHSNAPLTSVNEDYYYEGSENYLVLWIDYDLTFRCDFQLKHYPFDTQICNIEV